MSSRLESEFFSLGTQYYLAGRYSALGKLLPVCGNQFHHAVEMYLKGTLCANLTVTQLKGMRHNLKALWKAFKGQFNDPALSAYDRTISTLHKFEIIRYPDAILQKGMQCAISFQPGPLSFGTGALTRSTPQYGIVVPEIDSLVKIIFQKASWNPKAYILSFPARELRYLRRWNKVARFWGLRPLN